MIFGDSTRKAYSVVDPMCMTTEVRFMQDDEAQEFIETYVTEDDDSVSIRREFRYDKYNDIGEVPDSILVNDGFPVHCVCGTVVSVYRAHYTAPTNHVYCSETCYQCMTKIHPQFAEVLHKVVCDNPGVCIDTSCIYKEKRVETLKFSFPGSKHDNMIVGKMGTKYLNCQVHLDKKDIASWNEFQSLFED